MKYSDVEQKALDMINKSDFRQVTKDDVVGFVSMLQNMDPEVAKQIITQYPQLVKLIYDTLNSTKETFGKTIDSNDASTKQCYEIYNKVLDDLGKCLDQEELTSEERMKILEKETEIAKMAQELDSSVKSGNWKIVSAASYIAIIAVGIGAGVLGGKFNFKLPTK